MELSFKQLAAIRLIAEGFAGVDGQRQMEEYAPLCDFLLAEGLSQDEILEIMKVDIDGNEAVAIIAGLDEESKQKVSNLLSKIADADGECSNEELETFQVFMNACGLPMPQDEEEERDPEDMIMPAFLLAKTNGLAKLYQTETEEWASLGSELASCINAERLEVVRYTNALNQISNALQLTDSHLVFLVDRNGYTKDVGDNMTGTILYGTGHEIMGDIIFCLETDNGYKIKGIDSRQMMIDAYSFINQLAGNLLRLE